MAVHTILGPESALARELAMILYRHNHSIRTVHTSALTIRHSDNRAADPLDYEALVSAITGSNCVYLLTASPYLSQVEQWPSLMRNSINASKESGARLIFLDSAYVYGVTAGLITEQTPYCLIGEKARISVKIAMMLQEEMAEGKVQAVIGRTAEEYGPGIIEKGTIGAQVFKPLSQGKSPLIWQNPDVPRSLSFMPDTAQSLYLLANAEKATGRIWHLPAAQPPITLNEVAGIAAKCLQVPLKLKKRSALHYAILRRLDKNVGRQHELVQWQNHSLQFNSLEFEKAFCFKTTTYQEGILQTAMWFKKNVEGQSAIY